ncbi:MAG: hypothetical protein B6I20_04790 [Bacteroidetes bacterium 4572_117]|nr:MAG: hypothetical protein B6I20_04790 [Bacteroidetes bacterium 4572_117]
MLKQTKMLMIGGATRNVGKTTFSCSLIKEFSKNNIIIGLKIKTLYKDDSFFHGKDRNPLKGDYRIIEEFEENGVEDTMRMLKAGAKQVFRIKVKSEHIGPAFDDFLQRIPDNSFILCESNSLRKVVEPGLFIMIKHKNSDEIKPSAKELEPLADRIVFTDGENHGFNMKDLVVTDEKWVLKFDKILK